MNNERENGTFHGRGNVRRDYYFCCCRFSDRMGHWYRPSGWHGNRRNEAESGISRRFLLTTFSSYVIIRNVVRETCKNIPVVMAKGSHLFPYRTQKLSLSAPMVLGWRRPGRVGHCRIPNKKDTQLGVFFIFHSTCLLSRAVSDKCNIVLGWHRSRARPAGAMGEAECGESQEAADCRDYARSPGEYLQS